MLQDDVSDLLSDLLIEYLTVPVTSETPRQIRKRLDTDDLPSSEFLIATLIDAYEKEALPDDVSDLLADLFIEYLTMQQPTSAPGLPGGEPFVVPAFGDLCTTTVICMLKKSPLPLGEG